MYDRFAYIADIVEPRSYAEVEKLEHRVEWTNKSIFKIKVHRESVDRFKARLVVRGFKQEYGIDFDEALVLL